MKKIKVEGYDVTIERDNGVFIVSVPELPGCTTQVDKEEDIQPIIKSIIGDYLRELVSKRPNLKEVKNKQPRKDDKSKPRIKK